MRVDGVQGTLAASRRIESLVIQLIVDLSSHAVGTTKNIEMSSREHGMMHSIVRDHQVSKHQLNIIPAHQRVEHQIRRYSCQMSQMPELLIKKG